MIRKLHPQPIKSELSKNDFSPREKDFLDLVCNFLVDDIIKKVNNEKKDNRVRSD